MSNPATDRDGADGAVRVARAVLLAAVTLAFSAAAHTAAGGENPSGTGLVLLGSLTLVVTGALGRRPLTPWSLVPTLLVLQSALHLGFQMLAVPAGGTTAAGPGTAGHHAHHGGHDLVAATDAWAGTAAHLPPVAVTHSHPVMLLAHLAAVVAVTLLAVGADRALGRTVGRVARLFGAPLPRIPVTVEHRSPVRADGAVAPRTTLWMVETRPHRGPPPVLGVA